MSTAPTLSILIPVRNEGLNLKIMLRILSAIVEVPHEVLVAHDTVEDDSIGVVKKVQEDYDFAVSLPKIESADVRLYVVEGER